MLLQLSTVLLQLGMVLLQLGTARSLACTTVRFPSRFP